MSMEWAARLRHLDIPLYLAVQDGMVPGDVPWADIGGVFIGGTLDWKAATACEWVTASHARGKPCHYARCGTAKRVAHAKAIGADSLDSCLPLWSREKCATFLGALAQAPMFLEGSL
jgi:queuine/archaeosine tRNA-ribosyltransferase